MRIEKGEWAMGSGEICNILRSKNANLSPFTIDHSTFTILMGKVHLKISLDPFNGGIKIAEFYIGEFFVN